MTGMLFIALFVVVKVCAALPKSQQNNVNIMKQVHYDPLSHDAEIF